MKQISLLFFYFLYFASTAQTPSDGIVLKQAEVCVMVSGESGRFSEYWEGTTLRSNQTIATVYRNAATTMAAMGIFDRLNLYASLPYVMTSSTEPNGGYFAGVSSFQDWSAALKAKVLEKTIGKGKFSLFATLGFSMPMVAYLSDYMPYSVGLGTTEWSYRAVAMYKLQSGFYARTSAAYHWRGYTEAERDFYYSNGTSFYSATMDVPNAWSIEGIVGVDLWKDALKIELNYARFQSLSGDDIRPYAAPQPTNHIDWGRVGVFIQYYVPRIKGLGVIAYGNQTLSGRNMGKSTTLGVCVNYLFSLKNK